MLSEQEIRRLRDALEATRQRQIKMLSRMREDILNEGNPIRALPLVLRLKEDSQIVDFLRHDVALLNCVLGDNASDSVQEEFEKALQQYLKASEAESQKEAFAQNADRN